VSRGNACITYQQYKEFLERVEEAEANGKKLIVSNIAYDWGVKVGTLKSIRQRGIKKYDARLRKEQVMEELNREAWELLSSMYHANRCEASTDVRGKIRELLDRRNKYE
jgi:hypothetical protein